MTLDERTHPIGPRAGHGTETAPDAPPSGASGSRRLAVATLAIVLVFALWIASGAGGSRVTVVVGELGQLLAATGAAVACGLRSRRESDGNRRSWALLAASCATWAAGQVAWSFYDTVLGRETPSVSLADIGFLAAVPLAAIGMASFPPSTGDAGRHHSLRTVLDGVLVAGSVLFVSWVLILSSRYRSPTESSFVRVLNLAYPVGNVVTVAAVVILLTRQSRSDVRRSIILIGLGFGMIAVADTAFAWLTELGTFEPGNIVDVGWFAGFALVALGAAHPGSRGMADPDPLGARPDRSVYIPFVPGALALVVAMAQSAHGELDSAPAFFGFALVGLLGARLVSSLRENVALNRQLHTKVEVRTEELRETEARFGALVRRSTDLIGIVSPDGVVLYQSPSIERVLGHRADELVGTDFTRLVHPDDRAQWQGAMVRTTAQQVGPVVLEWRVWHADGSWHILETTVSSLLDETTVGGLVLNSRDVTERKALEEQLRHNAFHDPLTGLANRALFRDRLEHALAASGRSGRTMAVLFLDLDDFKAVNDGQGHDAGDEFLIRVAGRLLHAVRDDDTVARIGGDEFAVLLEHAKGEAEAELVARRLIEAVAAPVETPLGPLTVGVSIGLATATGAEDAEELMRNADTAMYKAKGAGGRRCEAFRPDMHEAVVERVRLEADLRGALEREEFVVHYQPIVDLADGSLVGAEALLRWMHPVRGLVPPMDFVPLAEATGLIVPIGTWLLNHVCKEAAPWRAKGRPLSLSVNVSPRQLTDDSLVGNVRRALERASFAPERLTLEITESVLVGSAHGITSRLQQLRDMGVRLAIDDFGTGYSSLSYLKRLPVDELKIDRSFVAGMGSDTGDASVVGTILSLAHHFRLETVAEGVEEPDQLAELQAMGCSRAQGYYLARPMPGAEIAARLGGFSGVFDHPVPGAPARLGC